MQQLDIRSVIAVACKYRRRAIMVFAATLTAVIVLCLVMTTQYEATAKLLVKIGRELVYRPEVGNTQTALPTMDKDNLIESNIAILKSDDIARQAINTIGLKRLYPKLIEPNDIVLLAWAGNVVAGIQAALGIPEESAEARARRRFGRKLTVVLVKKTDIIAVSFMHPDPEIAAQVANMVVGLFQQKAGAIYSNPNLEFMQKTVDGQRAALAAAEARLNDYRHQYSVYAFDTQIDMLLKQRMEIDTGLKSAEAHIAELNGMLAALHMQQATTPQDVRIYAETERHKAIDDAQSQLLTLTLEEKQLASRFADSYQPLVNVRNQIRIAQNALAAERSDPGSHTRRGLNDTWQEVNQETLRRQAELNAVERRREAMQSQLAAIDAQIAELSGRQRQLLDLQHDVELRADAVKTGNDKLIEARATDGLNREKPASFSLVEAAVPPEPADPARPLPLLYTFGAAVFGIIGGAITILASHILSDTFVTAAQAGRRLNMPVLAVISYDVRDHSKKARIFFF